MSTDDTKPRMKPFSEWARPSTYYDSRREADRRKAGQLAQATDIRLLAYRGLISEAEMYAALREDDLAVALERLLAEVDARERE